MPPIRGRLTTIEIDYPFIDRLAQGLIGEGSLSGMRIFLPTRRACIALREALLRYSATAALLLPRIIPLGGMLELEAEDDAPRTRVLTLQRRLLVLQLVERWQRVSQTSSIANSPNARIATALTNALLALQDDLLLEEVDIQKALEEPTLVPTSCARHWRESVKFLQIITKSWPQLLEERGLIEPASERIESLNRLADEMRTEANRERLATSTASPSDAVIIAGSTGSVKATARLMREVLGLPNGRVVLAGCPATFAQNAELFELASAKLTHPFHAFAMLFNSWNIPREELASLLRPFPIKDTPSQAPTERVRSQLLLASMAECPNIEKRLAHEGSTAASDISDATNLRLITCSDSQEEADIVSLLLRESLEKEDRRAALITRDRELARRVRSRLLGQWNVRIEDTASYSLAFSEAARVFSLLLQAVTPERSREADSLAEELPLDIFALKGLFALLGGDAANAWSAFEARVLRKPSRDEPRKTQRAARDLRALQRLLASSSDSLQAQQRSLLENLLACIARFALVASRSTSRCELLKAHSEASEAIASLADDNEGLDTPAQEEGLSAPLYRLEGGAALARLLARLGEHWREERADEHPTSAQAYRQTLEALLTSETMPGLYASHPRIAILGPLEARLLAFDRVILGCMVEGIWPRESEISPFLPNAVREKIGMKNNQYRIGLSALDFLNFASTPKEVYITRAERINGRPQAASRFVQRLETISGAHARFHDQRRQDELRAWSAHLAKTTNDTIASRSQRSNAAPAPKIASSVPDNLRLGRINLTSLADLLNDPYTVYARQILRLAPLEKLQQDAEQALYGSFIHKCFERIIRNFSNGELEISTDLQSIIEQELQHYAPSPFVGAFWREPLRRSARLLEQRLSTLSPQKIWSEVKGEYPVELPSGRSITISAQADLIVQSSDGEIIIIDHKTGILPSAKNLRAFEYPQLLIGAWMLGKGAFSSKGVLKTDLDNSISAKYWRFSGKLDENKIQNINEDLLMKKEQTIHASLQSFYEGCYLHYYERLEHFDKRDSRYCAKPLTTNDARFDDYAYLARRREWVLDTDFDTDLDTDKDLAGEDSA